MYSKEKINTYWGLKLFVLESAVKNAQYSFPKVVSSNCFFSSTNSLKFKNLEQAKFWHSCYKNDYNNYCYHVLNSW